MARRRGNPKMTKALAKKAKALANKRGISYPKAMGILMRGGKRAAPKKKPAKRSSGRATGRRAARGYRPIVGKGGRFSSRVKSNLAKRGVATKTGRLNPRRRNSGDLMTFPTYTGPAAPAVRKGKKASYYKRSKAGEKGRLLRIKHGIYGANKKRINPKRRRGKNPNGIVGKGVKGLKALFTMKGAMSIARVGVGAAAGMAVAGMAPILLSRYAPGGLGSNKLVQVVGSAAILTLVSGLIQGLKLGKDITGSVAVGGAGIIVAQVYAAISSRVPQLPKLPGMNGLGSITTASQLVDGEALYGGVNDFIQLSGPVPEDYFAGGLNDYTEFTGQAAGAAAQIASAAQSGWSPGAETSF